MDVIGTLIWLLIILVIMCAVYFIAKYILQQLKAEQPAFVILNVIFGLLALLLLLYFIYPYAVGHSLPMRR